MKKQLVLVSALTKQFTLGPDGTIYFADGLQDYPEPSFRSLYAVNPDGTLKWKVPFPGSRFNAPPVIDKAGSIFICLQRTSCYGIGPNGNILWQIVFPDDEVGLVGVDTAPLITSDGVMLILDSHDFLHMFVEPTSIVYLPLVSR